MRQTIHRCFLTFLLFSLTITAILAQRNITGKVTSAEGESLPGVSIVVKGEKTGAITDIDGNFAIQTPQTATLVFSYVGFSSQEIALGVSNVLNVTLESDATQLGEVIVTAFGISRAKKGLTYAAQDVSAEQITRSNDQNLVSALQGQVSGALITSSSGAPGAGASIILRGINSLDPSSDNQPLIVIDGIIVSNATNVGNVLPSAGSNAGGNNAEQFSNSNRLSDINPNDIESLSVLKGPSATALYGSLAQNGAIVITTKSGSEGKAKISFSTNYGVDEINKYPAIQSTFREGVSGRIRVNADNSVSPTKFQDFGPLILNNPVYNNFRDLFTQGNRLTTNLSLTGGKKGFTYLFSGSNFTQSGIVPNTDYRRTTLRFNSSYQAFSWLKLSGSASFSNSDNQMVNGGDKSVMSALSYHSNTYDVNDYQNADGSIKSYAGTIIDNPRWLAQYAPYTSKVNRYTSQVSADAKLFSWLSMRYQIGLDQYTDVRKRIMPDGTDVGSQVKGFTINDNLQQRQINSNLLFTIKKELTKDLKAQLLLGNSVFDSKFEEVGARGEGLVIPQFYDISNANKVFPIYDFTQTRLIGAFGELSLDYKNFLYLTASGRNDWTSTLPKSNNSFFYPSVGLSFVFSEALKLDENVFTYGKIRASYAETGKGTSAYLVGSYFEGAPRFPFGSTTGFRRSTLIGAEDLRPERTKGKELGLEMRFFNRFGFDLTLFDQNTIDQIFRIPTSNAVGFSQLVANSGEINNKGVELSVNLTPIKTKDFKWDMRLNFTKFNGTVKSVAAGVDQIVVYDGSYIVNQMVAGGRVGDLYGYNIRRDSASGQMLIGTNGYPLVNATTRVKVGNAIPDFVSALTNSFSFKGLSLSAQLEWKKGGDVYDMGRRNAIRNGNIQVTEVRHELVVFNGVLADGTKNTKEVEIDGDNFYRSGALYNATANILLQDASWVRLRNVSLSYSVPTQVLKKARIGSLTLTLTGNNLWLNTPYVGFDPEALQNGSGSSSFGFAGLTIPSVRNYSIGLNASF